VSERGLDNPGENPKEEAPAAFALVPILLAFAVLGVQIYLALGRNFANVLETPFLPYCLLGAFAIHLATGLGRKELICTLGIAAVSMTWFLASADKLSWSRIIASGAFAGLTSLTVLAIQVIRLRGSAQTEKLNTLFAGSVFGFSAIFIAVVLNLTTKLHPRTYDLYLYAADQGYGFPIIAWVGQLLARSRPLFQSCTFVYESLPLAVSLLYAYQRSGSRPLGVRVLPAFIGGGGAVYLLYNILPAAGPYYVFGKVFPYHLPQASALQMVLVGDVARNAMPSMHVACALLIFWNCRRLPLWIYVGSAVYLVLTALAAIGLGEHYVVDLVAAVPFALVLQSVCAPAWLRSRPEWRWGLAIGGVLTTLWIVAARFGTPLFHSGVFTWGLSILTLVLSGVARYAMAPAEAEIKPDSATVPEAA
jgi:hypothetical protein